MTLISWMCKLDAIQRAAVKHRQVRVLWSDTNRRSYQLPRLPFPVCTDEATPAIVICDLGMYIDSDVFVSSHVTKTISACFAVLRQLQSDRRSIPRSVFQSPVT